MYTFDNTYKLLIVFFENPNKEFHIRELARMSGLSPSGTLKILKKLEEKKLILKEETDLKHDYSANTESKEYNSLKLGYNLYLIKHSGLIETLDNETVPEAIVLFGSFSRGDNHSESDIDIAIFKARKKSFKIDEFEKKLDKEINIYFIDDLKASPELINNIINGITLRGFLKVV